MKALDSIALGLLIVGGLNWLLVGLFEFDRSQIIGFQKDNQRQQEYKESL